MKLISLQFRNKSAIRALIIALTLTTACFAANYASAGPLKIGFVYVSPIGDAGWTYQHDLGRLQVENEFGDKIQTKYIESVSEGPAAERVIRKLASNGYDLIFATSFGYMNPTLRVAKNFPKVIFEHATGYKQAKNVGNFSPRFYEGRYLSGIVAGAKTKSNLIGYVAAFPIPEVIRGINAFTLGAQSVNPNVKVRVLWINSWFDPSKESEAATSLISQGADIMTHHTDSVAIVKAAKDKGVFAIAYHSDMQKHGGYAQLGAVVHNWGDFYSSKIKQVLNGTWKTSSLWYGIKEGMVSFNITSAVDRTTRTKVRNIQKGIVGGYFSPFTGPIYDQKGQQRVKYGKTLTDSQLASMDYFVAGVEGKLGK